MLGACATHTLAGAWCPGCLPAPGGPLPCAAEVQLPPEPAVLLGCLQLVPVVVGERGVVAVVIVVAVAGLAVLVTCTAASARTRWV